MEKLKALVKEANDALKKADHLTYITYPQIKEIKLLYVITENLYKALTKGIEAVLHYGRLYKRVPLIPGSFNYELELFKTRCMDKYCIPRSSVLLIQDLKNLIETRKKGSMEFVRQDKFVICSDDYEMKILNLQKVKAYLADTKVFIEKVNRTARLK